MHEQDYDEDGNNIVPCPMCGDIYCPGNDKGVCPEEEEFVKHLEKRDKHMCPKCNKPLIDGTADHIACI